MSKNRILRSFALLMFLVIGVLVCAPRLRSAPAASELDVAWERVAQSGAYRFSADVAQTSMPLATVVNSGRGSRETTFHIEGSTSLPNESMRLTLWADGGSVMDPASGVDVRVEGDIAMARQGSGPWAEIEGFTGLFAPGGDPLAYTRAAENVVNLGTKLRTTPLGETIVTRYTFDIASERFAANMRAQLQEEAIAGGLPAHISLDLTKAYAGMSGTGELWVGTDGLPLRQIFHLSFPPDAHDYATSASMTVDFFDFDPIPAPTAFYRTGRMALAGWQALTAPHALVSWLMTGFGLFFAIVVVARRRSRQIYNTVAMSVILSMLVVPLLNNRQIYAYSVDRLEKQAYTATQRTAADEQVALQAALTAPRMDPNRAPLELAQQRAAADDTPGRYSDDRCESDPNSDQDGDGLTNLEECLLGTLVDEADSDGDGADDGVEVRGVHYAGTTWYTDPINQDSNFDGIADGTELSFDSNNDGSPDLDTNGDGTPDVWDDDNDGDGVLDTLDLSPYVSTAPGTPTAKSFSGQVPLELTLDDLMADELIKVEFQLQPNDPDHLWYSQNVLDWPQGDLQGNIQDADGKTFYDLDNSTSPSPNANGDVRMVPLLEIIFKNVDANLPPSETCVDDNGNAYPCYPLLEQFGIAVTKVDDSTSVAYVPLELVADPNGDANVAFYGRMFYQASGSWATPHQVRMAWGVQVLNDVCAAYTNGICTSYSSYNDTQIVHTYYDDWHLTGLHLTEEHSADMALVYEDPVETAKIQPGYDSPFYLDVQYGLLYGLDKTLLAGRCTPVNADGTCADGATRDFTVDDVYSRFNHATNGGVSTTDRWNLPDVLSVEKHEYAAVDLGLLDTTITQTVTVLDDHFTAAWTPTAPITPTITMVYEQQYRDLNLDKSIAGGSQVAWSGNGLTLDLAQSGTDVVEIDTMVSIKWTPYAYDPATGWATADIQRFWNTLTDDWEPSFVDPDNPGQAATYQTLAQHQYMAVYSGANTIVQAGDIILPAPYQTPDETISEEIGINVSKLTLKVMKAYYGVSEDLAEIATYLRSIGLDNNVSAYAIGVYLEKTVLELYVTLGQVGFIAVIAGLAIVALVAATTYFVSQAVHNTGVQWTLAISVGLLLTVFTVVMPILSYVGLLEKTIIAADQVISYGTAILRTLGEVSTLTTSAKIFGMIGLLLSIGIALGFLIAAWANGSAKPGSIAFNQALAVTIATIAVTVVLFVVGLLVLGGILAGILVVIDVVLTLLGQKTITGQIVQALAGVIYQYNLYTTQNQQGGDLQSTLVDPADGLTAGNTISFTLPITTTLTQSDNTIGDAPSLRRNSMVYSLSEDKESLTTQLDARTADWITTGNTATVIDYPSAQVGLVAGVNATVPLEVNVAWALTAQSCWVDFCSEDPATGDNSTAAGDGLVFDVLPATIDEFVDVSRDGWASGEVRAVDADGDGLLKAGAGGLDPDDTKWDTDGDGLSDAYELTIRGRSGDQGGVDLDPLVLDTDNDQIADGNEMRWGTDPGNQDTDDDGLLDSQEIAYVATTDGSVVVGGWALPYAPDKTTRVWSNPLLADADGDGLSDLFEQSEVTCPTCTPWADPNNPLVFNPNVWNVSPVALFIEDDTIDGYVLPGATVVYTSTTENNLGGGQVLTGKLSVDAPAGFSAVNTEATVTVNSGESESLVTVMTIDATTSMTGTVASTMQLTDFAGTVWSWDAPRTTSAAAGNATRELNAVAVTGWSDPVLLVTHETAGNGTQSIVAHVTSVSGVIRQSLPLSTATAPTTAFTGPDIACTDDGDCLVVWGATDATQTGSLWISLLSRRLPTNAATRQIWQAANTTMNVPTVATDNNDYMLTWATEAGSDATLWSLPLDSAGDFKLSDAPQLEPIQPTAFQTASASAVSGPQTLWDGSQYSVVYVENGSILRRVLNADTGAADAASTVHPGAPWSRGSALAHPPEGLFDPVSLQSLLLYRSTDNYLYAGRLSASGAFEPLALDTSNDFSVANVQTSLCSDPINGGWVAAWSRPGTTSVNYQAIGPDGTLSGSRQTLSQSATSGLGLACSTARPVVDLEFDEAEGASTFADASGFDNSASCAAGKCPVAGVEGRFGQAVRFNGASESAEIANDADFNFDTNNDFTVAFWVIADAEQQDTQHPFTVIASKSSGGAYPFEIRYLYQSGQIVALRSDGTHDPSVTSVQAINDGQFHHIAFVKRGGDLYLYVDGEQSGNPAADSTTGPTTNQAPLYLGTRPDGSYPFTGTLDRFQVYPRGLSIQEIGGTFDAASAIYDLDEVAGSQIFVDGSGNELTGTCHGDACPVMGAAGVADTAATFDGVDDTITVAPIKRVVTTYAYDFESGVGPQWSTSLPDAVLELEFDEAAGATTFADSSGGGHNAICSGATCPQAGVAGRNDRAVQFSGQNEYLDTQAGDFVEMGRGDFTIAAWIKTTATDILIVSKQGNAVAWESGERIFYLDSNGRPAFQGNGNGFIEGTTPINNGQWRHVAVTWDYSDGTSGRGEIYVDGTPDTGSSNYLGNNADNGADTVKIGRATGSGYANYFVGAIDQIQIFDQALSVAQVAQIYSSTPARYDLDQPEGYCCAPSLGDFYLGQFANETASLSLSDLPLHDTVKVQFDLLPLYPGGPTLDDVGWDGNRTDQGLGPDRWAWGHDGAPMLNTSFAQAGAADKSDKLYWGFNQAYPSAYSVQAAHPGIEILAPTGGSHYFDQDTPNLANTPVGDDPTVAYPGDMTFSVVHAYQNANFGGQSLIWDPWTGEEMVNQKWPSWVSSMRIWPSQHLPGSGGNGTFADGFDGGDVYTLQGTIANHTADAVTLYFQGQSSEIDPGGVEMWGLDNVEVTLERDQTSIPLTDQSFTLAAWAKNETAARGAILSQGAGSTNQGLVFGFRDSSTFTCAFWGNALNTSDAALIDEEWHYWACTYDAASRTRILYRDGIQVAQDTASETYLGLGPTYIGSQFGTEWFFDGQLDEVATWRDALSADDILELHNKVKVEDQSVMVGTILTANGTASIGTDEITLRETATRVGSIAQTVSRILTVDPDNPTVCPDAGACPSPNRYVPNSGTLVVAGTAADATSYIRSVEVNDGGWQPLTGTETWSYAWNISGLNDGEQRLPVRATDVVGHVSPVYDVSITLDSTPPQVAFAADTGSVQRPTRDEQGGWLVALSGAVNDPAAGAKPGSGVATVEILLDRADKSTGQNWQPATITGDTWIIDYVLPAYESNGQSLVDPSGTYSVALRATDTVSNTTLPNVYPTLQLRLDAAGPTIAVTNLLSSTQLITTAMTVQGTVNDADAVASVDINFTPAEQIAALAGSILYLPLDERTATHYYPDQSGANNAASCNDDECPMVGQAGQRDLAAKFDGQNDTLVSDGVDLVNGSFTLAAWAKRERTGVWANILSQSAGSNSNGIQFGFRADNVFTCGFLDDDLNTTEAYTDAGWHHWACTYDATSRTRVLYRDGVEVVEDTATTNYEGSGPFYIGSQSGDLNYFDGLIDEAIVYDHALAWYEVANLHAYGQGVWEAAALEDGAWSYAITEGEEGLEGLYQINVRGIDGLDNMTSQGEQRLWRGEIDTKPPMLQYSATTTVTGSVKSTTFTCQVTDFNLDLATSCVADSGVPTFRSGDKTLTTYDEVDAWYAANITDTSRLYAIDAVRTYSDTQEGGRVTACDLFGRCASADPSLNVSPPSTPSAVALEPVPGNLLTSLAPIFISGHAFDARGLDMLFVKVNDKSTFFKSWQDGKTDSPWRFTWTPPEEGVYRITPLLTEHEGVVPLRVAENGPSPEQPSRAEENGPVDNRANLPYNNFLPQIANGGRNKPTDTRLFLPVVQFHTSPNEAVTGMGITLYVDLTPPTVDIDPTALTGIQRLGHRIVQLSGPVYDATQLFTVEVRIDDGPWDLTGFDNGGHWRYPWVLASPADGESHIVTVRATDIAGRSAQVTKEVTVDISAPTPGPVSYAYVNAGGETIQMSPGDRLTGAEAFTMAWGEAIDDGGPIRYYASFTRNVDPSDDHLPLFDGPGSISQSVASGERWYATVRVMDPSNNVSEVDMGPFYTDLVE